MRTFAFLAALAGGSACAAGVAFTHKDWELACDNTRTCRAAGYQREGDEPPMSVLLTREAGPRRPVKAQVLLTPRDDKTRVPASVTLTIAGRAIGSVAIHDEGAELDAAQVRALLEALRRSGEIAFVSGAQRWRLSDAGATAVLLRMDEAQGRVGTTGALVRKGATGEDGVLPPLAKPVVRAAALPQGAQPPATLAAAIVRSLPKPNDDCEELAELPEPAKIWRLKEGKVLVSARCWRAAYNVGHGYWVANDKPPHRPQLVTHDGSDFLETESRIVAVHKGRGIGDCHSVKEWVWDGARFVPTEESTTGMCRLVAAGGPWSLPTLVTEVVPPAGKRIKEEKRK